MRDSGILITIDPALLLEITDNARAESEEKSVKSIQWVINIEEVQLSWSFISHLLGKS